MKLDCHLRIVMRSSRIGTGKDDHLIQYSDNYAGQGECSLLCQDIGNWFYKAIIRCHAGENLFTLSDTDAMIRRSMALNIIKVRKH